MHKPQTIKVNDHHTMLDAAAACIQFGVTADHGKRLGLWQIDEQISEVPSLQFDIQRAISAEPEELFGASWRTI